MAAREYLRILFEGETTGVYCSACAADAIEALADEVAEWEPVEDLWEAEACDVCGTAIEAKRIAGDMYSRWAAAGIRSSMAVR